MHSFSFLFMHSSFHSFSYSNRIGTNGESVRERRWNERNILPLIQSFIHYSTHSFIHIFIYSPFQSFIHSTHFVLHSLTDFPLSSHPYSFTHISTYSFLTFTHTHALSLSLVSCSHLKAAMMDLSSSVRVCVEAPASSHTARITHPLWSRPPITSKYCLSPRTATTPSDPLSLTPCRCQGRVMRSDVKCTETLLESA